MSLLQNCIACRRLLEPLAEVERALLVVEVLHLPHPELGGLLSGGKGREHLEATESQYDNPKEIIILTLGTSGYD